MKKSKEMKKMFFLKLLLKFNRIYVLFLFFLNCNKIFEYNNVLYENENDNDDKQYSLIIILKGLLPLRQLFYFWLAGTISLNYIGKYDKNAIIAIVTIIEVIDKSIIGLIEQSCEENLNNISEKDLIPLNDNLESELNKNKNKTC
jgi:hypothetical protein